MKRLVLVGIMAFAVVQPTQSLAYDDPAVAVCEWYVLNSAGFGGDEYHRVDANVVGETVQLRYEVNILNLAPELRQHECVFGLHFGRYEIVSESIIAYYRCENLMPSDFQMGNEAADRYFACLKENELGRKAQQAVQEILEKPIRFGIYPILPENTALNPGAHER